MLGSGKGRGWLWGGKEVREGWEDGGGKEDVEGREMGREMRRGVKGDGKEVYEIPSEGSPGPVEGGGGGQPGQETAQRHPVLESLFVWNEMFR